MTLKWIYIKVCLMWFSSFLVDNHCIYLILYRSSAYVRTLTWVSVLLLMLCEVQWSDSIQRFLVNIIAVRHSIEFLKVCSTPIERDVNLTKLNTIILINEIYGVKCIRGLFQERVWWRQGSGILELEMYLQSRAVTIFALSVLMLFGVVVFSNCNHYTEDLYRLDLKSFSSKMIGFTFKWHARSVVGNSHDLPCHPLSAKRWRMLQFYTTRPQHREMLGRSSTWAGCISIVMIYRRTINARWSYEWTCRLKGTSRGYR